MRDLLDPQNFVNNIVEFHKATGASVCVVLYDQKTSRRPHWKGLTHQELLSFLERKFLLQSAQHPVSQLATSAPLPTPSCNSNKPCKNVCVVKNGESETVCALNKVKSDSMGVDESEVDVSDIALLNFPILSLSTKT